MFSFSRRKDTCKQDVEKRGCLWCLTRKAHISSCNRQAMAAASFCRLHRNREASSFNVQPRKPVVRIITFHDPLERNRCVTSGSKRQTRITLQQTERP